MRDKNKKTLLHRRCLQIKFYDTDLTLLRDGILPKLQNLFFNFSWFLWLIFQEYLLWSHSVDVILTHQDYLIYFIKSTIR